MSLLKREFNDRLLEQGFQFIPRKEQEYIAKYAKLIGINDCDFTKQEYTYLRKLAKKYRMDKELILTFDRAYCFTHSYARRIRTGAHNSITGMGWSWSVKHYAEIARLIEGKEKQ